MQFKVDFSESDAIFDAKLTDDSMAMEAEFADFQMIEIPGGGVDFTTDETLTLENGVLSVNRATDVEKDNTLPITSAAVYETVGNINALLESI